MLCPSEGFQRDDLLTCCQDPEPEVVEGDVHQVHPNLRHLVKLPGKYQDWKTNWTKNKIGEQNFETPCKITNL